MFDSTLLQWFSGTMRHVKLLLAAAEPPGSEVFRPKVPDSPSVWMPNPASTFAESLDGLFSFLVWTSSIVTVGVVIAMVVFVVKFKATSREANEQALSQEDHSNLLEVTWSAIPLVLVIVVFVLGFQGFMNLRSTPREAYEVHATGQRWKWGFEYPEGLQHPELHVPVGQNVRVMIQSVDVLHSLSIPEFRVKMDAVPGRYTDLWFQATQEGTFPIYCAEYCGTAHSDMLSQVVVHSQESFEQWVAEEIRKIESMPLVDLGKLTYGQSGCATCHSLDGAQKVGPSFLGLFGRTEALADGTSVLVDENYLRESILAPQAKIVNGFPPSMPTFKGQLSDRRISGLVEYIKTIKQGETNK